STLLSIEPSASTALARTRRTRVLDWLRLSLASTEAGRRLALLGSTACGPIALGFVALGVRGLAVARPINTLAECSARPAIGIPCRAASSRKSGRPSSGLLCSLYRQNSTLSFCPG